MHVGRDDDPKLALAPLRIEREEWRASWGPRLRAPQPCEPEVPAHLAVQYDHVLWVSTEPRLHGFADGTQLVQGGRMQLRPAEVLDLGGVTVGATSEERWVGMEKGPGVGVGWGQGQGTVGCPRQPASTLSSPVQWVDVSCTMLWCLK